MKTPKELGITRKQFNNLLKLAKFLNNKKNLPKEVRFDMFKFCEESTFDSKSTTCGSVGCAVGFAPFAGIKKKKGEDWLSFSLRTLIDPHSEDFEWMFGSNWDSIDNTPKGAAKRIFWFLKNGTPENAVDQRDGLDNLCYNTSHLKKQ